MKIIKVNNILRIENNDKNLFLEILNNDCFHFYVDHPNPIDLIELNRDLSSDSFFEIDENDGFITVKFEKYNFVIYKDFSLEIFKKNRLVSKIKLDMLGDKYITSLELYNDTRVFGLGDKMAFLDKRGYEYSTWNTDDPTHQDESYKALYKSINYLLVKSNDDYFGCFFPSTYRYDYDICKYSENVINVSNKYVNHDFYLFLGDNIKKITSSYSSLVGHPYFIRYKMLGYNQSRWTYASSKEVMEVVDNFKKNDIPLDYIHLDINYMDGFRDFTFDKNNYENVKELTTKMKEEGVDLIVINDAGIKQDDNYDVYAYLEKNKLFGKLNNETYINEVWPGDSAFPNYFDEECKKYINKKAREFILENGISGIWNDMNEPASFKGELPLDVDFSYGNRKLINEEGHNVYGEHMVKSLLGIYEEQNIRPYIFSRAASATTAKYAFVWNGDNASIWHHLKLSIPQILSLSLSNFMLNGVDVGGFNLDTNKQLYCRWIESAVFTPFLRNHSSIGTKKQEPYSFDEEAKEISKRYISLRYTFAPYLYNLVYRINKYGELFASPMFYHYQDDLNCLDINDQYMVGKNIIVAPIVDKDTYKRIVYLPKGEWINIINNNKYEGNNYYIVDMPLGETGIFIKNDSIIPMINNTLHLDKEKIDTLVLKIYGNTGKCEIYDDDGVSMDYKKDIYNLYYVEYYNNTLSFKTYYHNYNTSYKYLKIIKDDKEKIIPFEYNFELKI